MYTLAKSNASLFIWVCLSPKSSQTNTGSLAKLRYDIQERHQFFLEISGTNNQVLSIIKVASGFDMYPLLYGWLFHLNTISLVHNKLPNASVQSEMNVRSESPRNAPKRRLLKLHRWRSPTLCFLVAVFLRKEGVKKGFAIHSNRFIRLR